MISTFTAAPTGAQDTAHAVAQAVYEPLFAGHELKPIHEAAVLNGSHTLIWPAIFLFIALALLVFARVSEPKKLLRVFTAFYSIQASKQLQREDYKIGKRLFILLLGVFLISLSFLIYLINNYFGLVLQSWSGFGQFAVFAGVVAAAYTVKYIFSLVLGYIINASDLIKEYIFNVSVFNQVAGIVLFPFIIAMLFSKYQVEWFLYPAIVIFLSFYAFRFVRGFIISGMERGVGLLYIFLYLCALEILPLLVLIKFLLISF